MPTADRDQVIQLFALLSDMARREQSKQALTAVRGGGQVVGGPGGSASANYGPKVSSQMPDPEAMRLRGLMNMTGAGISPEEAMSLMPAASGRRFGGLVDEYGYDPAAHDFMEEMRRQKMMDWVAKMAGAVMTADEWRGTGMGSR
jgi:shikimate 5-dehydrogenase